jgi:hypothetical protein
MPKLAVDVWLPHRLNMNPGRLRLLDLLEPTQVSQQLQVSMCREIRLFITPLPFTFASVCQNCFRAAEPEVPSRSGSMTTAACVQRQFVC